jgi:hypothetical protein
MATKTQSSPARNFFLDIEELLSQAGKHYQERKLAIRRFVLDEESRVP